MTQLAPAGAMVLFALASGYATLTVYRDQQAIAETESATAASLSPGPVKLNGRVEAIETVTSPVTGEEGVVVDWSVEAESDDDEGGADEHVAGGLRRTEFLVADGSGQVRVEPPYGADLTASDENTYFDRRHDPTLETLEAVDEEVRSGDGDAEDGTVMVSQTHGQHDSLEFKHEILKPGDEATVIGTAEESEDGVVVGEGDGEFLVSDMSEDELTGELQQKMLALAGVTVLFVVGFVYFIAFA